MAGTIAQELRRRVMHFNSSFELRWRETAGQDNPVRQGSAHFPLLPFLSEPNWKDKDKAAYW